MTASHERGPIRPRLAPHVLARRHLLGTKVRVVLHDVARDARLVLGAREWAVLSFADGSRDLEGIRIALALEGLRLDPEMLASFIHGLDAEGLLVDGTNDPDVSPREAKRPASSDPETLGPTDPSRPVRVLPGYSFHCDAGGLCCGLYPTILFAPLDVVHARAAMPDVLDGGDRASLAFTPENGSRAFALSAGAFRDGRCAYQRDDGLCAIHAKTGELSKPVGCRLYPLTYVDDGESVRVSLVAECPCAFRSHGRSTGSPLLAPEITRRDQLEAAAHVDRIEPNVAVTSSQTVPSEMLPAWSLAVHDDSAHVTPQTLLRLATAVARHGLDPRAAREALAPASSNEAAAVFAPRLAALAEIATRRAREDAEWRAGTDPVSVGLSALAAGASVLSTPLFLETALDDGSMPDIVRADERLYVRAGVFGHQWIGRVPLADAIRDRATRMLVARAVALGLAGTEPIEHPLGRVEAIVRTHGLSRYARLF